jgi:hypothetical protein
MLVLWFRIDEDGSVVIARLHAKRDLTVARERIRGVLFSRQAKPPEP